MTIAIKPTASGSTIEQDGSTILTVDGSGNITPSNQMYPKVPTFASYLSANQVISSATWTKVAWDSEAWDNNSNFDTTNNRFLPTVAGYYSLNTLCRPNTTGRYAIAIRKNGTGYVRVNSYDTVTNDTYINGCALVEANGTTDYFEIYIYGSVGFTLVTTNSIEVQNFQGHLVSV